MKGLAKWYYDARALAGLLRENRGIGIRVPLAESTGLFLRGYAKDKNILYRLKGEDAGNYLPDRVRPRTRFINGEYGLLLNNKLLTEALLGGRVRMPATHGWIQQGHITLFRRTGATEFTEEDLRELLPTGGRLVLKPLAAAGGRGVTVLEGQKSQCLRNGEPLSWSQVLQWMGTLDQYLLCEFMEQGAYGKGLFPGSTNTIRVLTMRDPATQAPFIAIAVHKIGTQRTQPVDNFNAGYGGLTAKVDLDTGVLGKGVQITTEGRLSWHSNHPDTRAPIEGVAVPEWSHIGEELLSLAQSMPYITYAGWDIVVREDGLAVIEVNNHSGFAVLQVHEPLLKNPAVRRFYTHHKII